MRTITRDIVAALLFSSDNKLLLGKTDPAARGVYSGHYVIPGGGIEPGETRIEALNREIMEETRLDISELDAKLVDDTKVGHSEKTLKDTGEHVKVTMNFIDYEVRLPVPARDSPARPTDELVVLDWIAVEDLATTDLSEPTLELLKNQGYL